MIRRHHRRGVDLSLLSHTSPHATSQAIKAYQTPLYSYIKYIL
jgi:hypothetical protein